MFIAKLRPATTRPHARTLAAAAALTAAGIAIAMGGHFSRAAATPPNAASKDAGTTARASTQGAVPGSEGIAATTPATTRIEFSTVPFVHATVSWGKTVLGHIAPHKPLVVVRPRDSGPLDVTIYARGFLPVHTRAQTFEDSKVAVKLTRIEDKATLFGYREPLDAGPPDGGAPIATPGAAGTGSPMQIPPAGTVNVQPQAPFPAPAPAR